MLCRRKGFSLIEMLLVMALISILSMLAWPSLKVFKQRFEANLIRTSLTQALQETRLLAIVRHQKLILCGSGDGLSCGRHWEHHWLRMTSSHRILDAWHFSDEKPHLHYRFFPKGRGTLVFLPNGWPEIENGTFWYCLAPGQSPVWVLILDRFGHFRIGFPGEDDPLRCH